MSARRPAAWVAVLLFASATIARGQSAVDVRPAELAVPFGSASGTVILVADQLVFVDDDQVEMSFAIARRNIKELEQGNGMVTITTNTPVRDRTGERSVLRFRLANAAPLVQWHRGAAGGGGVAEAPASAPAPSGTVTASLQARHDHRIGGCEGRLIISDTRLAYESVNEIGDSRQWVYRDIRELRQDGPYRLQITPFVGNTYNLELIGEGLDTGQFSTLVDRVTAARVGT